MSPLKNRIHEIESAITSAERQVARDNESLVAASQRGDGKVIMGVSVSIHDTKKQIDNLFDELEVITVEHDALAREFEEKLQIYEECFMFDVFVPQRGKLNNSATRHRHPGKPG